MLKGYETLELSTQMIIKEALLRGIKVEVLDWEDNLIRLTQGRKVEYIKQATKTSLDTYIVPLIMENKVVTKVVLKEQEIRVPEGSVVHSVEEGLQESRHYFGKAFVIKPKSTNFGLGVAILQNNYTEVEVKTALQMAFQYDSSVLLEEYITGKEYRILVIGDEVIAALHRVPANVQGDGIHTIRELVEEKNKNPLRGKGYVTPLEKLFLGQTENEFLSMQEKNPEYIPDLNEVVYLRENSNISTGGDSIDFTDDLHEGYKELAVRAAKATGARICGVDMMIQDINKTPEENSYGVIEINFNPALHIHDFPYQGENRKVEKKVLDLLGFTRVEGK